MMITTAKVFLVRIYEIDWMWTSLMRFIFEALFLNLLAQQHNGPIQENIM